MAGDKIEQTQTTGQVVGSAVDKVVSKATEVAPSMEAVKKTVGEAASGLVTTVDDIFKALAKAFPEIAGKGFQFYAEYIFAQGVSYLISGVLLLIVAGIIMSIWKKYIWNNWGSAKGKYSTSSDEAAAALGFAIPFVFVAGIFLLQGIWHIQDGVVYMIAPEGAVVNEIVKNLQK